MKLILTITLILIAATGLSAQSEKTKSDFRSLYWLEGKWTRSNMKRPGHTAIEYWEKTGEYELSGRGATIEGKDTVFIETLKIIIKGNEIHYVADVPENPNPVTFVFTKIAANLFICENPQHDFPKKISYQLEGHTLKAQTSGGGKVQAFTFVRARN